MAHERPPYPTDRASYVRWISQGVVEWDEARHEDEKYHHEVLALVRDHEARAKAALAAWREQERLNPPLPKLWHYRALRQVLHGTEDLAEIS